MKIFSCIKPVPNKDARLIIREDQKWIKEADVSFDISECDLYALEEALRIKEKHGGEVPRCLKFADDFAVKSADNGRDFRTRPPAGCFPQRSTRGLLMKSLKLIGLALGASLALSSSTASAIS